MLMAGQSSVCTAPKELCWLSMQEGFHCQSRWIKLSWLQSSISFWLIQRLDRLHYQRKCYYLFRCGKCSTISSSTINPGNTWTVTMVSQYLLAHIKGTSHYSSNDICVFVCLSEPGSGWFWCLAHHQWREGVTSSGDPSQHWPTAQTSCSDQGPGRLR